MLNDLSKAAANVRSEVEKLFLEGPAVTDVQQKYDDLPWNVNPVFLDDSYVPRFENPVEERSHIYRGVYPEY